MAARLRIALAFLCVSMTTTILPSPLLHKVQAQTTQPSGGFLEKAGTAIRSRWTRAQLQAFLPSNRGKFIFPAPYNTEGVRLTDSTDCGSSDCLLGVGYSYWRNSNNHVNSNQMLIFLTFYKSFGGAGPTLFSYDKTTDQVTKVGPLFDVNSPYIWETGEGWYFSATLPTTLYMNDGPRMLRYDVISKQFTPVLDITATWGTDYRIWQMHSSNDDSVHSMTIRRVSTGEDMGCSVYLERTHEFRFYPKVATYDECHVDKSGRYLLIQEVIGSTAGVANRYIDIQSEIETRLLDAAGTGTLSHNDIGFGYVVGGDRWNPLPNATAMVYLDPSVAKGPTVNYNYNWDLSQVNHITHSNAKAGIPLDQEFACGSNADRISYAQNEIVCFRLNTSMNQLIVAPVMTDLNAAGGCCAGDYSKLPKGNLDITGRYFIWTTNIYSSHLEAFVVKVPSEVLFGKVPLPPPASSSTSPGKGKGKPH